MTKTGFKAVSSALTRAFSVGVAFFSADVCITGNHKRGKRIKHILPWEVETTDSELFHWLEFLGEDVGGGRIGNAQLKARTCKRLSSHKSRNKG